MIKPYCLITATVILCVALYKCIVEINVFHLVLLLLGFTSVAHHSRLDRWWIQDWVRTVDNLAVVWTGLAGFCFLNEALVPLWLKVQAYGLLMFTLIAGDLFHSSKVPMAHATTHLALILFLIMNDTRLDTSSIPGRETTYRILSMGGIALDFSFH